jgi:hypothetical protein
MIFADDLKIKVYNNPNEKFWSFDGDFLTVYNEKNEPTVKYVERILDFNGKWHLSGRFMKTDNGWRHYLE